MKEYKKSEFFNVKFLKDKNILKVQWLCACQYMSEIDFHNIIYMVYELIRKYKANILYVDAAEFNYPIRLNTINLVKEHCLKLNSVKYKILDSKHRLGSFGVLMLLRHLSNSGLKIELFPDQQVADLWLKS